jgi:hypothetical protein
VEVRVTMVGEMFAFSPDDGASDRVTVPVKPLRPVTVIVTVACALGARLLTVVGLAVTVKSTTWTLTVIV